MTTREERDERDKLSWRETYRAIASAQENWSDLDAAIADGLGVEPAADPIAGKTAEVTVDQVRTISKQGPRNQIVGPEAPHD